MVNWSDSQEEKIIEILENGGACRKCCQRFLGKKQSYLYKTVHQLEMDKMSENKQSKPNPCVVCLGILQDVYMMPRVNEIITSIKTSGYDADKFTLSISLPISLSIREHSLWLHLEKAGKDIIDGNLSKEDVTPLKQVWKYVYPELVTSQVGLTHESGDTADFYVELVVLWEKDTEEMKAMERLCPKEYAERAKKTNVYNMGVYSRQGVDNSLENIKYDNFAPEYPVPPAVPDKPFDLDFRMSRNSIWIGGRYNKYTRHLPQTPWLIKGVRKCGSSVEELIGDRLKEYLQCEQVKFLSSGREDVDVRMLGSGRPFAFECVNSKKTKLSQSNLDELTKFINENHESVQVNGLAPVSKSSIKKLKQGEEEKRKKYTALCRTKDPYCLETLKKLEEMTDLVLKQETPIRVLHRRSNAFRDKVVHSMNITQVSPTLFKLEAIAAAGTYIKELVHGDFERTQPNLCTLLGLETDILALDVEEVFLEWPLEEKNGNK